MNIRLHIERLVVEGVPLDPGGKARLEAAVRTELTRLMSSGSFGPALRDGGAAPALHGSLFPAPEPFQVAEMGRRIARSVHEAILRGR